MQMRSIVVFLAGLFLFVYIAHGARASEHSYDLNVVRMRYFHLLNLFPADNTLVPAPGRRKSYHPPQQPPPPQHP
ncbi:MAG: hypothetical protein UZ22_OP11002001045 [Microgenomates bacterium OLB23]|nr:MAG: hypothetical protein UZ22_OP11002001045 [Microgenomates bacterium OLB23]